MHNCILAVLINSSYILFFIVDGATIANRKRFIIDVLTDSLLNTGGLDSAIDVAVKEYAMKGGRKADEGKTESISVIADFAELLLKIVTIDSLERLSENEIETTSQRSNFLFIEKSICMILRYQRLLFARLFKGDGNFQYWPSSGEFRIEQFEEASISKRISRLESHKLHRKAS